MTDADDDRRGPGRHGDDPLLDAAEAARRLEVTPENLRAMVDQGLLTPAGTGAAGEDDGADEGSWRFRSSEVLAARQLGG